MQHNGFFSVFVPVQLLILHWSELKGSEKNGFSLESMKNLCLMEIAVVWYRSIFINFKNWMPYQFFFSLSIDFLSAKESEVSVRMPLWHLLAISSKLVQY